MTTKNSKTGTKAKKAVAASTKVTSGTKRAVKRERVQMVKPAPSSPMPAPVFDAPAPIAQAVKTETNGAMNTAPANGAMKPAMNGDAMKAMPANGAMKPAMNGDVKAMPANGAMKPAMNSDVKAMPANGAMKPAMNGDAMKAAPANGASEPERRIARADFELMVRRTAYQLAQRRQFRGGSPAQDWFAAEAAVKADLQSRGISLAN